MVVYRKFDHFSYKETTFADPKVVQMGDVQNERMRHDCEQKQHLVPFFCSKAIKFQKQIMFQGNTTTPTSEQTPIFEMVFPRNFLRTWTRIVFKLVRQNTLLADTFPYKFKEIIHVTNQKADSFTTVFQNKDLVFTMEKDQDSHEQIYFHSETRKMTHSNQFVRYTAMNNHSCLAQNFFHNKHKGTIFAGRNFVFCWSHFTIMLERRVLQLSFSTQSFHDVSLAGHVTDMFVVSEAAATLSLSVLWFEMDQKDPVQPIRCPTHKGTICKKSNVSIFKLPTNASVHWFRTFNTQLKICNFSRDAANYLGNPTCSKKRGYFWSGSLDPFSWAQASEICARIATFLPIFRSREELVEFLDFIKFAQSLPAIPATFIAWYKDKYKQRVCFSSKPKTLPICGLWTSRVFRDEVLLYISDMAKWRPSCLSG